MQNSWSQLFSHGCRSLLVGLVLVACQPGPAQEQTTTVPNPPPLVDSLLIELPYQLTEPLNRYALPSNLNEISGLTYFRPGQLGMVQDELGRIFVYDLTQRAVVRTIDFALPGDFEGVEWDGQHFYALRSDGILFRVDSSRSDGPNLEMLKTFLNDDDDVEGLGYRADTKQLLLACKEPARHKGRNDRFRAIFVYDLLTQDLLAQPLTIDLAGIQQVWQATARSEKAQEEADEFDVEKEKSFKPSAIAVHPLTGHYYVLASAGKLLVVLDPAGQVLSTHYLSRKTFSQPEGICFSPKGTLYISNEARDETATLLEFEYQPHE